jgi:hypothetical protein
MLQNLDDQARDCVKRAADCAEHAKEVANPRERDEWLALKSRYLAVAEGLESRYRRSTFRGMHNANGPRGYKL